MQFLLALAVQQQDEPADRIGAAAAIVEHLREIRVAAFDHVLLESGEQIGEETERQIELADGLVQRDENEMQSRRTGEASRAAAPSRRARPDAPRASSHRARPVRLGAAGVAFVGEVVGIAREGVDGMDMGLHFARHEPAHGKILVMRARQLGAGLVGIGDGFCIRECFSARP